MNTIYEDINTFLNSQNTDIQALVSFANDLIKSRPRDRRFVQEWFLHLIVKPKYTGELFNDIELVQHNGFSLDAKDLTARQMFRK